MNRDKNGRFISQPISYFYKVVRPHYKFKGSYESARCGDLLYKVGKVTYPKISNSKIFVFESYQDALKFRSFAERIFLCKAKNAQSLKTFVYSAYGNVFAFWNGGYELTELDYIVPEGTYGCDSCELLIDVTNGLP